MSGHDARVPERYDVVGVGAGLAGLATAWWLARDGCSVVVLEQFELGHTRGSSHGTSRIFRLSHDDPADVRDAQRALELWRELEAEAGEPLLELNGLLDLRSDPAPAVSALDECDVPYEVLDRAEVERRFGVRPLEGCVGVFQADGGIAYAERTLVALRRSAEAHGATIRAGTRALALADTGAGVSVETSVGRVEAGAAVVAAGAWVARVMASAGVEVPVRPTLETVAYFAFAGPAPPSLMAHEDAGPIGYALEAPGIGLKAGLDRTGPAADPDVGGAPDQQLGSRIAGWVRERLPAVAPEPIRLETCLYTNAPGETFVFERHGRIVIGSACSGRGFKFGPLTGRRLADLAREVL